MLRFIYFLVDFSSAVAEEVLLPSRLALVGFLYDREDEHCPVLEYFIKWCERANLVLNTTMTIVPISLDLFLMNNPLFQICEHEVDKLVSPKSSLRCKCLHIVLHIVLLL